MNAQCRYKDIDYSLKKSDRKTTSIYIERDGSVSVLAPSPFDMKKIESIIENKRSWIYRNLAEWEDLNRTRVHREYVNGESFLYLGRRYTLNIVNDQAQPLLLKNGQFQLAERALDKAPTYFRNFYKSKLLPKVQERTDEYCARLGRSAAGVRVMELSNRWGSCTFEGVINIHWKCAMLPLRVLDYVIAHEVCHLVHTNHTAEFWHQLEKIFSNYDVQKQWLKFNGAGMSL